MADPAITAQAWPLILAAAGVGALVSTLGTLVGQHLERTSRRRELLLKTAIDLAENNTERTIRIAEARQLPFAIQDSVVSAEVYYQWLLHLSEQGRLPEDPRIKRGAKEEES